MSNETVTPAGKDPVCQLLVLPIHDEILKYQALLFPLPVHSVNEIEENTP